MIELIKLEEEEKKSLVKTLKEKSLNYTQEKQVVLFKKKYEELIDAI